MGGDRRGSGTVAPSEQSTQLALAGYPLEDQARLSVGDTLDRREVVEDEVALASVIADDEARDRAFTALCEALRRRDVAVRHPATGPPICRRPRKGALRA